MQSGLRQGLAMVHFAPVPPNEEKLVQALRGGRTVSSTRQYLNQEPAKRAKTILEETEQKCMQVR